MRTTYGKKTLNVALNAINENKLIIEDHLEKGYKKSLKKEKQEQDWKDIKG